MPESVSNLERTIRKLTTTKQINQFHAHLLHRGLLAFNFWVLRLLNVCTALHAPPFYTRCIFDSADSRQDVDIFTAMLRYYSSRSDSTELIALFRRMYASRLFPDPCVYPALIKAGGNNGISLHSHLIKVGGNDLGKYTTNALIRAYGKYGPIESARHLFDEMTDRSIADWNALLVGYWNWGHNEEAKRLFDLMPARNVISWTTMVTGFSRMKDLESARDYFDRIPEKNVVSWNAMISGYAQNGFSEESLSLFREMVSLGFVPDETTLVAVISSCSSYGDQSLVDSAVDLLNGKGICLNPFVKTALLDLYAKRGQLELARSIFDEMKSTRNSVTWNSMISAYLRAGKLNEAAELFSTMPEKDVVSWNTMIAGYAQHGESILAVELFDEMLEKSVIPDEVTMVSVLSACGHLGAQELGIRVAEFIAAKNIRLSLSGYNSLIFMYSRCGSMMEAEKIFSEIKTRDVVSYNALITGYASHGNAIDALKLMQKMREEGVEPDRITYAGVLTACSHSGMIEEGRRVFQSIENPDMDHYGCIIDLLGRVGRVDEAKKMMEEMAMDPHHDGGIYGSLVNGSRIHGRLDVGELAALKLVEVEPENSGNYVLLSNMYACGGKWEEVDRVREAMKARGMAKVTGWSCVEIGGKIQRFTAADRKHERTLEIYDALAGLLRD